MSAYFTARSNIVRDELERPDYSPITDDTPKMFALKESFRRSGLTSEHFDIDPFRYNSMSAWYQGVMKERGLIVDNPAASIASTKPSCGNAPDEDQDFFSRSGDSAVDLFTPTTYDPNRFRDALPSEDPTTLVNSATTEIKLEVITPYSSDSTITDPALTDSAHIDFNYQEPAYEYAAEPVLPPLPAANLNLAILRPTIPIIQRRLSTHPKQIEPHYDAIAKLSYKLSKQFSSKSLSASKPLPLSISNKKRSADECLTPRTVSSDKRTRLATNPLDIISANISDQLADLGPPSTPASSTPTPHDPNYLTYPGQFTALTTTHLSRGLVPTTTTFPLDRYQMNANGTYTHTACHLAPPPQQLDYSARFRSGKFWQRRSNRREEQLHGRLQMQSDLAVAEHVSACRDGADEQLRGRLHQEASQARLLGVSAGEYRYYQGHLTVEEMVEWRVCVCWEVCACSAVCTRWPDMKCPCSEYIRLEVD